VSACRIKLAANPDSSVDDRPAHLNGASRGGS
jgi:hypothetical protein